MAFSVFTVNTVTGDHIGRLPAALQSWSRELNGSDAAQVTISPGALTPKTRDLIRLMTTPAFTTLVVDWDGVVLFAGPIWSRTWDGTKATINAAGLRTIFARRKALNWVLPYQQQVLSYSNMSLGSIAAELGKVATSISKTGASLPIVWPSDESDTNATNDRTYDGFDLTSVDSAWSDLTGVEDGPDIDLQPEWVDASRSQLQYLFRVGTDENPAITSPNIVKFDAAQPKSQVNLLTVAEDASNLATTEWAKGSGQDVNTLLSVAQDPTLIAAGWPLLEGEQDYTDVEDQPTLDAHAAGDLAAFGRPTEQWGLTVDGMMAPVLGSYLLGDVAEVRTRGHVWIPDGANLMRIVGISGDATQMVTLDVQGA